MNYEEFICFVQKNVQTQLGKEVGVELHQITKNNDVQLDGLSIVETTKSISPTIYLNDYFQEYQCGTAMAQIIDSILNIYQNNKIKVPVDTDFYTDYMRVKNNIACKVINYKKNTELLKTVPHVQYLDLAIVFYYFLKSDTLGTGTILIHDSHLKMWKITKEILYETARKNTPAMLPFEFKSMEEVMDEIEEGELEEEFSDVMEDQECDDDRIPMYVLSNKEKTMGAACILYDSILTLIGERLQDDFYILPSSIHECIVVPKNIRTTKKELQEMVREINETQVIPEEVLSNEVYTYTREIHRLAL